MNAAVMTIIHQIATVGVTIGPLLVTSCLFTMIMVVKREIRGDVDPKLLHRIWNHALVTGFFGSIAWWGGTIYLKYVHEAEEAMHQLTPYVGCF